jgi:hypothetical protein
VSLSVHDRKVLLSKAGNRCSYNYAGEVCDEELVTVVDERPVLEGEECHIVGEKPGSPRYVANFPEIDTYNNRILMCKKHHKVIDDNKAKYSIEVLLEMKKLHEESIAERKKSKEIQPLIIKDSIFRTEVEHAEKAIGMEVNRPVQFCNVTSELIAHDVQSAIGFKTNQPLNAIVTTCSNCGRPFTFASTGAPPRSVNCPYCSHGNPIP